MAEPGRGSLRLGAVLALAVVALFEVLALAHGVRSARRLRSRVAQDAARGVEAARPALDPMLARGREAWDEAAGTAIAQGLASEVEVVDGDGAVAYSRPHGAPVVHRPGEAERRELAAGRSATALAREGPELRVLTYLPLPPAQAGQFFRLAARAPDLEDEAREWQTVLLGHAAALSALALAVVLVLWPRGAAVAAANDGALTAYEVAMGRLRDRGQELSDRYEEQTQLMEERLRELEAMARAGELTAGIVHEVRNGLGTIVGYARLLERGSREQASKEARAILDECATLETVVRRFTDFVKLDKLQLADIDLAPLTARVVARERRGHEAVVARLLGLDSPVVVRADEELLERALENVVRNAVQAAAVGGGHVELRAERMASGVVLHVEDDGPGLAADHPGHVRPFYTTRPGGLGLGLPLARKIVLLHGGELSLERRVPKGARVVLRLPADGPVR
ncbi:MAG TPA: HAMP domain-containing sensor histidine kinase [Myxococcota bacterium]|nr:HAMP domain-containing sensor histidine kinase [Myxococcota bacterium]